jgi:hypothetical protein
LLELIKFRGAVWVAFALSLFPILHDWDERIWPNDAESARRIEQRNESVRLRDLAISLKSSEARPFLAPWWLSPSIAYWSEQPGVGGSSHESLNGNADAARFFLAEDWRKAREILENRKIAWVLPTMPNGWPRIPRRFWGYQHRGTRSALCWIELLPRCLPS